MKRARFEWAEQNLEHIARHGVDPDEAEAALDNDPLILRTTDNKYLAYGQTDEGRYLPKLPTFASEQEAAEWFATHDTAPYMDELAEVTPRIPVIRSRPAKKSVGLRLRIDYLEAIKRVAESKGIPYQTLIQMWLVEKLRQEAPQLLQQ